jgi:hypothetical protein
MHARGVLTGLAAVGVAVAGLPGSAVAADDPAPLLGMNTAGTVKGSYIVVLDDDASAEAVRRSSRRADDAGGTVTHRYDAALKGYAAKLSAASTSRCARSAPRPDRPGAWTASTSASSR